MAIGGCLETSPCVWKPMELNGRPIGFRAAPASRRRIGVHFIANPKVWKPCCSTVTYHRLGESSLPPHNRKLETFDELVQTFRQYYEMTVGLPGPPTTSSTTSGAKNNMSRDQTRC